jgi:hypothetical protein
MERYLGLDVHAGSSTLVVLSESGRRLQRVVLETNGEALVEAVRAVPGRKPCASRKERRARGSTKS